MSAPQPRLYCIATDKPLRNNDLHPVTFPIAFTCPLCKQVVWTNGAGIIEPHGLDEQGERFRGSST